LKGDLVFSDEADEFSIAEDGASNDYVIKNLSNDKDIIIKAIVGDTDTEVARVVGASGSIQMTDIQKLEFDVATNYINSTDDGGSLNINSNGELAIDVGSVVMANDPGVYTMTIQKNIATEKVTSNVVSNPVLTIENTNVTGGQAGGVLEFMRSNTAENSVMGTIRSATSTGTFAQINFESGGAEDSQTGSIVFKAQNDAVDKQMMDINKGLPNTVSIGSAENLADLKVYGDLLAASTAYSDDILPGTRGVQHVGEDGTEWGVLWLSEGGKVSFGGQGEETPDADDDVELLHVVSDDGFQGLLLNDNNKIFFDKGIADPAQLVQFIGSKTAVGALTIVIPTSAVLLPINWTSWAGSAIPLSKNILLLSFNNKPWKPSSETTCSNSTSSSASGVSSP
jgi:hypothetical protein